MYLRTDKSWKQSNSMLFLSRNGGSWKWFVLLSAPKSFISLITNIFHVMPKISVFRQLPTMRRQISAICVIGIAFLLILFIYRSGEINLNWSLGRICLDLLLPSYFLTTWVRLSTSVLPLYLDVARHVFDETSAHLLNNRTKSIKESNDRFGLKKQQQHHCGYEFTRISHFLQSHYQCQYKRCLHFYTRVRGKNIL